MECKRIYDPIGSFYTDNNGNTHVQAMVLLPLELRDGNYHRLVVNKTNPINISDYGYNGFLIVIECVGKPDSLKNEAASDLVALDFTIKKEEGLDFTKGKKIKLFVLHNNEFLAKPEDYPELVPCMKTLMRMDGYDPESNFDDHPSLPCVIPFGPLKTGESILPGS